MESSEEGEIRYKDAIKIYKQVFDYKIIKKIGEGTFGQVFLSKYKEKYFALKKIPTDDIDGISITTLREITILKKLMHKNIIEVIDIVCRKNDEDDFDRNKIDMFVVFPYYEYDLSYYIKKDKMKLCDIKNIGRQILEGLNYLHTKKILHRDLKPANILLGTNLQVKIADFGLARIYERDIQLTPGMVTLWYRAPELLLKDAKYTYSIDIWSFGCILAEMFLRKPILMGETEIEQLEKIICLCGSINERTFPGISSIRNFNTIKLPQGVNNIENVFIKYDKNLPKILSKILKIDPKTRLGCKEILEDIFFIYDSRIKRISFDNGLKKFQRFEE